MYPGDVNRYLVLMFIRFKQFLISVLLRKLLFLTAVLVFLTNCTRPAAEERPNIILIMSDDMGFSDLGCYGGEIHTPNLDQLAREGVRFTQFYNTARCCPTRASLLTGLYPHQTGIGHMANSPEGNNDMDYGLRGYQGYLNQHCVTIAEALKGAGYATLMAGKWHIGMKEKSRRPLQRGFDKYYGILAGATNYYQPQYPRGIWLDNDSLNITDTSYYTTDRFTAQAIDFIDQTVTTGRDHPFFLYLAFNAPHWPLQAPKEDIDKYRDRYVHGWDPIRRERFKRQQEMGLIDDTWELTPGDARAWDSLPAAKKDEMALRMAIYAAQIDRMDQNIGRLVDYLRKHNMLKNTVIFFLDDNGACAEGGELGGGPAAQLETREGYFLTLGRAWANAANTPFRRYKHWIHEGGISSPFIVHWPAGMAQANKGGFVRQYGFLPDIMATCIALAGAAYPTQYAGQDIYPMEGKSLLPLITGQNATVPVHTEPIFWEHEGNKGVRDGNYKLVMAWPNGKGNATPTWELYDMVADRTEMHDLASQMPKRVTAMEKQWQHWAETHQVAPWPEIVEIRKNARK